MGTLSYHQAQAGVFLQLADFAMADQDPDQAAGALRRAACHITTVLSIHYGWPHKSRQQLETALHVAVADESLSRSHIKTFRQVHTLRRHLASRTRRRDSASASRPRFNPAIVLRRMRRRVASLIAAVTAFIEGQPKPVLHHKLWQRNPDLPPPPEFSHTGDIIRLPNFQEIQRRFNLQNEPIAAMPDPHGSYARGLTPRRCPCHAALWNQPRSSSHIILSPLWQRALEKTFRVKLPDHLRLNC